jgi:hypothetical protein
MRSVGCGATRIRWRHGTGGKTLPQLESYKVTVGVAGPSRVRPAAWTKSGEKAIARIQASLRGIPEDRLLSEEQMQERREEAERENRE